MVREVKDHNTVAETVTALLIEFLGVQPESVKLDSDILNDLGADSLDRLEVLMALEEKFNIKIDDEDTENVRTVTDLVNLVIAKTSK